jgi:hypothetical protein
MELRNRTANPWFESRQINPILTAFGTAVPALYDDARDLNRRVKIFSADDSFEQRSDFPRREDASFVFATRHICRVK